MKRLREKGPIFEAVQWTGSNWHSVLDFCGREAITTNGKEIFLSDATPVPVGHWLIRKEGKPGVVSTLSEEALAQGWEEVP